MLLVMKFLRFKIFVLTFAKYSFADKNEFFSRNNSIDYWDQYKTLPDLSKVENLDSVPKSSSGGGGRGGGVSPESTFEIKFVDETKLVDDSIRRCSTKLSVDDST